ncbi:UDP-N-acetylmuramoyl-L-alanine--D-glutamate ligase [Acetobacter sp. TBRC 12305]|uniref:UDP-N-acetylmuramoylalanine--D-glutamate ligase n=1 Tax=Acetobacter garciniae TaxID=2817435 RepID=A0A939KR71_9PROT|nr:UDP-N-acetylmuramoyl-L-alanine--D-glutamate ligase [Acetobacter garciniae]MBO1326427.1 UDP-N-acetylmuramoyl-L-alanine--D-glutamate ligase [Acetobacter garciniae]MBX0346118.1 UDP-N-acetylmuramoyl-L-alanine--D-glutamate ligase [Acetobacter garciniae]
MTAFPPTLFAGKRFAVFGLGRNGLPAVRTLAACGASVQAWDDGEAARHALAEHIARSRHDGGDIALWPFDTLEGFDALILSPGIAHVLPTPHPIALMARDAGIPILSDAELLYQAVRMAGSKARFAGITGTNGKSTTTALLAHILSGAGVPVAAGGNLGPAALSLPLLPDDGVYVLEMSSYMLERLLTLRFDTACLLNLTPDHLDRHGDMAGYTRAKCEIFARQSALDHAVIGVDDPLCAQLATTLARGPARCESISGSDPACSYYGKDGAIWHDGATVAPLGPTLPGAHNAQNAAAALAMAHFLGVAAAAAAQGVLSFPGLPHRQQRVAECTGVTFIDDSKATNADAASRALSCYDRLVWIAGGMAKAGGIATLAPYFGRIVHAYLIGRDAAVLGATLDEHGVAYTVSETLENAVPAAYTLACEARVPVVLLSPACASFDQFAGFEARGARFAQLAKGVCAQHTDATGA